MSSSFMRDLDALVSSGLHNWSNGGASPQDRLDGEDKRLPLHNYISCYMEKNSHIY